MTNRRKALSRWGARGLAFVVMHGTVAREASAQMITGVPGSAGPSTTGGATTQVAIPGREGAWTPSPSDQDKAPLEQRALGEGSVKLFDMRRSTMSLVLDGGPLWADVLGEPGGPRLGLFELGFGSATTTPWDPFYLAGHHRIVYRGLNDDRHSVSLQGNLITGLRYGVLAIESRIGLGVFNVSAFDGEWSVDSLSPRCGVGAAVHLGGVRLDIQANTEYLWRWFGRDAISQGLMLGLRLDLPPANPVSP
jgi:hypothetical protein